MGVCLHDRHSRIDITSGNKHPDLLGILNYKELGGSNEVRVQIRVENPSQYPQP